MELSQYIFRLMKATMLANKLDNILAILCYFYSCGLEIKSWSSTSKSESRQSENEVESKTKPRPSKVVLSSTTSWDTWEIHSEFLFLRSCGDFFVLVLCVFILPKMYLQRHCGSCCDFSQVSVGVFPNPQKVTLKDKRNQRSAMHYSWLRWIKTKRRKRTKQSVLTLQFENKITCTFVKTSLKINAVI